MNAMKKLIPTLVFVCLGAINSFGQKTLENQLTSEPQQELAILALKDGNSARGALLFHSPTVGCNKCHRVDDQSTLLGPNLAKWTRSVGNNFLVESVLNPSKHIEPLYRTVKVVTAEGDVHVGLVLERNSDVLNLGVSSSDAQISIPIDSIEQESSSDQSIMPAGQVNNLQSKGQFLDLIAYLIDIRDGGASRAKELQPSPDALRLRVPEYESHVDHAGLIRKLNEDSFERGKAIYVGLCIQCHGTLETQGSLPTALRFGEGKFKRGNDPYSIYHTLTHGAGLMLPQVWMVPRQKYDVAHYIRQHFVKAHNKHGFTEPDEAYLSKLPQGDTEGPEPRKFEPWLTMDYGPMMTHTIEFGKDATNIAQKAIAMRLDNGIGGVSMGSAWSVFEHDTLRVAGVWSGDQFIDWNGIQFNGSHGTHPRAMGDFLLENTTGPGWAKPGTKSFDDVERVEGRDKRRYGPLPASWGKYKGTYRTGDGTILSYTVGDTAVLEQHFRSEMSISSNLSKSIFGRAMLIGPGTQSLTCSIATLRTKIASWKRRDDFLFVELSDQQGWYVFGRNGRTEATDGSKGFEWSIDGQRVCLTVDPRSEGVNAAILACRIPEDGFVIDSEKTKKLIDDMRDVSRNWEAKIPVEKVKIWNSIEETEPAVWFGEGAWGVDTLTLPMNNPWRARVRVTGLDFYPDGDSMVVCTWDGDVWKASGLKRLGSKDAKLKWQRIANGLFQPLGILVDGDALMVTCRDQLARLHDQNGDGEIDYFECFNSDHQVTEHFHEFAMGLQRDAQGRWYYAKSARHALKAVVPQHGTLLRVSSDGKQTEILATGFRAANGVCLNDDGTFIVTDQEGHWNPKNRINWVREGGFYGNMFGYHSVTDSSNEAMDQPLCWITNAFDRSPAELLWVPKDRWGNLGGSLLNLSYGYGRIYVVPFEKRMQGDKLQHQGGMCQLPIPDLPTGIIRGRFSKDGGLYVGGMFAWASSRAEQEGGLYRVRNLGTAADLPVELHAKQDGIEITMTDELDHKTTEDTSRYQIRVWGLNRTQNYGSEHIGEKELTVSKAELLENSRTIRLTIPDLEPTWGMSVRIRLKNRDGKEFERELHNTIHWISKP